MEFRDWNHREYKIRATHTQLTRSYTTAFSRNRNIFNYIRETPREILRFSLTTFYASRVRSCGELRHPRDPRSESRSGATTGSTTGDFSLLSRRYAARLGADYGLCAIAYTRFPMDGNLRVITANGNKPRVSLARRVATRGPFSAAPTAFLAIGARR